MNEDFKAAKKKLEARKRIKDMQKSLKVEKAYSSLGIESPGAYKERRKRELDAEYASTPLETKQKFLDLMAEGRNLGQARTEANISIEVASQIILRNAESIDLFPRKAKV